MSLLFKYRRVPIVRPAIALGGVLYRPRPIVRVTLINASATAISDGLLDTGADDTVFPEKTALQLGIDLANAPTGEVTGVAAGPAPVRYAQVTLRITDGFECAEWIGWVGFTSAPLRYSLLGFAGCLQFFHADARGDLEEVQMTPTPLFVGRHARLVPSAP